MFNLFSGGDEPFITHSSIVKNIDQIKGRALSSDFDRIEELANKLSSRHMNFKHFLGFMHIENVFKK